MDPWEFSVAEAEEHDRPIVWGWALRPLPGGGMRDVPAIWNEWRQADNDTQFDPESGPSSA